MGSSDGCCDDPGMRMTVERPRGDVQGRDGSASRRVEWSRRLPAGQFPRSRGQPNGHGTVRKQLLRPHHAMVGRWQGESA